MKKPNEPEFERERERLISWVSLHPTGLVRTKHFAKVADEIATSMLAATHNSVITVVLVHRILDGNLRNVDVLSLFDVVHEHLCSPTFPSMVPNIDAQDIGSAVNSGHDDHFCGAFFEYYWARLGPELERSTLLENYPAGIRDIGALLLREYFPVFWNSLEDYLLECMFYASNLGWLAGGRDTDELLHAIESDAPQ